jgi:hypothetical protein
VSTPDPSNLRGQTRGLGIVLENLPVVKYSNGMHPEIRRLGVFVGTMHEFMGTVVP